MKFIDGLIDVLFTMLVLALALLLLMGLGVILMPLILKGYAIGIWG